MVKLTNPRKPRTKALLTGLAALTLIGLIGLALVGLTDLAELPKTLSPTS